MSHAALLKLELALRGVRCEDITGAAVTVDLRLPDDVRVAAPLQAGAPFTLRSEEGRDVLGGPEPATRVPVRRVIAPRFLERRTSRGAPMGRVASVRGAHLILSPVSTCGYTVHGAPCRFCLEGARAAGDHEAAPVADIVDVVRAALDEGLGNTVYFNTSFFDGEDGGIAFLAPYIEAVRRHFDVLVATQVHPPRSNRWVDRAYAMGVDAISYNLEIFDRELLNRYCIGRARYIGRERYLEALAYAAEVFPSGTVWTDLVAGLEPPASTMAGIDTLASMGVVPVVGLSRGRAAPLDPAEVTPVLAHLYRAVKQRGIAMGWVRGLALGITPFEARHFAGDDARLAVTVQNLTRSRLGSLAARSLARFRRRLRVRNASEAPAPAHS